MIGEYLAINHLLPLTQNFWFGHQGYEYIDLGRFWQIILFLGLIVWLILMLRGIFPIIKKRQMNFHLLILFAITSTVIGLFYGFGLLWGAETNLSIAEYWRWWVLHLWLEGFFEVFATVIVAYLFTRLGLIDVDTATKTVLLTTIIYLLGGVIGVFHHMYFTGTPLITATLGGIFGALEVVPLALIGVDAYHNYKLSHAQPWITAYKWPIYFFVAMCFWNLVGAGLFGFLINMPIALYYFQGLNTTALHSHGALFGVYGNLSIGLILFCLRGLTEGKSWNNKLIACAFWLLNIGLAEMCFLSLLPIGLIQSWFSINYDMWYARSTAFTHLPLIHDIIWVRAIGDILFGLGALAFITFIFQASFSKSSKVQVYLLFLGLILAILTTLFENPITGLA